MQFYLIISFLLEQIDVQLDLKTKSCNRVRLRRLGRGGFGFVSEGTGWKLPGSGFNAEKWCAITSSLKKSVFFFL